MPRIPEAQFRREPSVRIPNQVGGRIATPDKDIKQLGSQFKDIANKLDQARVTAEGLDTAAKVDEIYQSKVVAHQKYLAENSVNGKTFKGRSITEEMNKVIQEFQDEAEGMVTTGNQVSATAYAKYTVPKLQKMQSDMLVLERQQQVSFADEQNKKKSNFISEKFKNGEDITADIEEFKSQVFSTAPLLGEKRTAESLTAFEHLMGLSANEHVKYNSPTKPAQDAAEKRARAWIAKLPDAQREAAERELEGTLSAVEAARLSAMNKGIEETAQYATNPKEVYNNSARASELAFHSVTEPLHKDETPLQRADKIGKILGTQFGSLAALQLQSGSLSAYDDIVDMEIKKYMDANKNKTLIKKIGRDKVEDMIRQHAKITSRNFQGLKRQTGKWMAMTQESYKPNLFSGDPIRQQMAVGQAYATAKIQGLANEDIIITPPESAEHITKSFKEATTGPEKLQILRDFIDMTGPNAQRIMRETIEMSKGSMPEVAAIAIQIDDVKLAAEMMQDHTDYGNNLEKLQANIDNNLVDFTGKAKEAARDIRARFQGSKYQGLYAGRGNENHHTYKGMQDAIVARAVKYMARKNMSDGDAFEQAVKDFDSELMVGQSEGQALMVNKEFIKRYAPTQQELDSTAKELRQLKHLDNPALPEIDYLAMTKMFKESAILRKYLDVSNRASGAQVAEGKRLANTLFAKNVPLEISVDPDNPNFVKVYIDPLNGDRVPVLMKSADGGTEEMSIDLRRYFAAKRAQDASDRDAFMQRVEQGARLPRPEIVR